MHSICSTFFVYRYWVENCAIISMGFQTPYIKFSVYCVFKYVIQFMDHPLCYSRYREILLSHYTSIYIDNNNNISSHYMETMSVI